MTGLYTTTEMIGMQEKAKTAPDGFWLAMFTRTITSDKAEIQFDLVDVNDRRLAPFVAPNQQGKPMVEAGFTVRTFKPAYVKPKHIIDPSKAIPRMAGEAIGGSMSLEQRFQAHVVNALAVQRAAIERRWDWMAAQAVQFGSVVVSGENYPSVTVDFQRHSSLTYTLTSTARWGESAADPLGDIATARKNVFTRSNAPVTDVVFGTTAWSRFVADTTVLDLLDTQKRGTASDFNRSTALTNGQPYVLQGEISNRSGGDPLRLWTYSNTYTDEDGNTGQFLDPDHVVGYGGALAGVRMFGAIMDRRSLMPVPIFPKMWDQEDPSVTYCMSQSAPLMVPFEPNNTFIIKTRG